MTTITEEEYYNEHAALLGHVTLAWNDCHYMVFLIFHTLSGLSWEQASAIFLALKNDQHRRDITLELMKEILKNDQQLKALGTRLLGQLGSLAGERNAATHTMWVTVMPDRQFFPEAEPEIQPHRHLPSKNLKADFRFQFSNLTTNLRNLFRQLLDYEAAVYTHLQLREQTGSITVKPERD
jgi:hypothetical protein